MNEYSYHGEHKVFYDKSNFRKSIIEGSLIILLPVFLSIIIAFLLKVDMAYFAAIPGVTTIIAFLVFILESKKISGNNASFILLNGRLFKVTHMPSEIEALRDANGLRGVGGLLGEDTAGGLAAGAVLVGIGDVREEEQERMATNDAFRNYILDNGDSIKITKVLNMKKYRSGYKIKCQYSYKDIKTGKKSFYIFPGYNDYEELVSCFEKLKA